MTPEQELDADNKKTMTLARLEEILGDDLHAAKFRTKDEYRIAVLDCVRKLKANFLAATGEAVNEYNLREMDKRMAVIGEEQWIISHDGNTHKLIKAPARTTGQFRDEHAVATAAPFDEEVVLTIGNDKKDLALLLFLSQPFILRKLIKATRAIRLLAGVR